jgi:hypothetical protein
VSLNRIPTVLTRVALPLAVSAALLAGCAGGDAATTAAPALTTADHTSTAALASPTTVTVSQVSQLSSARKAAAKKKAKKKSIWSGKVRAYGDSVMLGAKSALQKRLHAHVNAAVSRQSYQLLAIVRNDFAKGRIHGPVVIHTGTNGTVVKRDLERSIKKIQKRHLVLLVNAKVNRGWVPGNNRIIGQVDSRWANVISLNWHKLASRHPGWLSGYHLNSLGAKKYAKAVAKKLRR